MTYTTSSTDRIAAALRRADYMNWTSFEVAEKIAGTVESLIREERDRIRSAVEALPTNHVNWYGPDGEHEDHGYVVRQQDVYDLLEPAGR